jgi:membrane associated rhomboid family serine protease
MKKFKETPVSSFIAVLIIVIFSLYLSSVISSVPCEKNMLSIFYSNFIHLDFYHLFSNLIGIYALSRVEYKVGPQKFIVLFIFLLVFNTIMEVILHKIINTKCSIGLSGVLYGIATFDIICDKKIDYTMFVAIILSIGASSITSKNSSLSGHIIGALSGIIGATIFKQFGYFCI